MSLIHRKQATGESDLGDQQSTYFVDARDPEPEELNFLLCDPFPPPGGFFSLYTLLLSLRAP